VYPPASRYFKAETYQAVTAEGATVTALVLPRRSPPPLAGYHPRSDGDRLDLLAVRYLDEPTGFWRLCDVNNAMVAGALEARALIAIPVTG
jgi:hypothetical protein